ncbi:MULTISPECIES: aminopeptidase P family protein [Bordetella]|uniref:Xaa-Pro aminopeptidase n=1 Tax=Bordetella genomosp. 6 TaxID=463024 RepID=A0ABX4FGL6_9BORD|nr:MULTISPECIES: aminopeptidase P family protein [Bordetella]AZW45172.1 aminopeptidase P family protein [Bordetella bronchiseptica]KDC77111.1 metallopeptidase family M24 [Bordetella bronchiseptica MBORD635]KDD28204.1 metallopeptidase family M24 [Bordetella bronchiseptica MBORD782]MBN3266126.1 aminopeptidase P family protein [Bordetella bronchiseptica]OZI81303.1 Xaa-Pro aminopeptidase [Bordetella genomosp. 6]
MSVTDTRIGALRRAMRQHQLDAYIVPSADPHLSEYLPGRWQGRRWLSGFTGSVGTLVVTRDFAGLWVDSRYWVQAENQLAGTGVTLMKIASAGTPGHVDWLAARLPAGSRVGVDGQVLGLAAFRALSAALAPAGIHLDIQSDLLQAIWSDRPGLPSAPVHEHVAPHACEPRAGKLARVRAAMREHGADAHWLSTLDDIAWLFNLRGSDVEYNPVFLAHALVGPDHATLFVADGKIDAALRRALAVDGVETADYALAAEALGSLQTDQTLLIDPARVTCGVFHAMDPAVPRVEAINPSTLYKSRKSDAELASVRAVMEQDGAALCEFFAWFEGALGREPVTELTIDERITAARGRRPGYVCPSFATIAGFNANGAMPHYRATPQAHAAIEGDGLLLIDSGGQYLGGTTDITRVVAVGAPSADQKVDFTLVLKGMIALSRASFPRGTPSPMLDAIARAPIWAGGAEYGHGTGHGVGYFLNVHEGPQVISYRAAPGPHTAMEPGMITSNEPGIYRPGRWGVRIENLVANRTWLESELGEFLCFETLTLCPIDTRCIDATLLRADEIAWLDDYHRTVRERLAPWVEGDALQWLQARTRPLGAD